MENRETQKWKIKIKKKTEQNMRRHMKYKLKYYVVKALCNAWFLKCWDLCNLWLWNKAKELILIEILNLLAMSLG